jgi:hypothetical protein
VCESPGPGLINQAPTIEWIKQKKGARRNLQVNSIPVFHHSIIPGWKKKNGGGAIPYYQAFLEIPIY